MTRSGFLTPTGSHPRVLALGTANPAQRYSQREIYDFAASHVEMYRNPRIEHIFMSSDIDYRYVSFNFETLDPNESADAMHARFEEHSVVLGRKAVEVCLDNAGLTPSDIDYVVAVSCTGYLCPGLSAILIKELGMRNDVQRADLVGMGCAGAMPGLQRAFDFVKAYPEKKALLIAVEVCSACYYVDDSLETVVGNAICGDGAAAALIGGDDANGKPELVGFQTLLEPSYINAVGFQTRNGKLRIVLSKDLRAVAGGLARKVVGALLERYGLHPEDVRAWVIHSGGRKVIDSIKSEMNLTEEQLHDSRCVLRNFGNMSSPTVLYVLDETMRRVKPGPGDFGVMLAMGPGLAVESALLQW